MARIVLVADDSPTIQKRALGILKGEGFEVETVSNGVAAIKRLAVLHPVVVLADVSMPGRDGYEVCEFVKKSPELSQVPVLLVASDMEPYDEARGAESPLVQALANILSQLQLGNQSPRQAVAAGGGCGLRCHTYESKNPNPRPLTGRLCRSFRLGDPMPMIRGNEAADSPNYRCTPAKPRPGSSSG